jgi:hypothetical protein
MQAHFNIYVSRAFHWYKEHFNPISFDPWNCLLKIQESIGTPTPKLGVHLGVWGLFPRIFLHSREHEMWLLSSLLAHTFASPCFGREPKVRVATTLVLLRFFYFNWDFYFNQVRWHLSWLTSVTQGLILKLKWICEFFDSLMFCIYIWNVDICLNYPRFACSNKGSKLPFLWSFVLVL